MTTPNVSTKFAADFATLTKAAQDYNTAYANYKLDQVAYKEKLNSQLAGIKDPFVLMVTVLRLFASQDPVSATNPRGNATVTGLYEAQLELGSRHLAVMAALTQCTNDIQEASNNGNTSDPANGTTLALRQNANAMNLLLDATKAGGILSQTDSNDINSAPLDPTAVSTYHTQLRAVRADIFNADANGVADTAGDSLGTYNVLFNGANVPNKPSSATDTTYVRTYHLSTVPTTTANPNVNLGVSTSYTELLANAQLQGDDSPGTGMGDASKGARIAMQTMTNAFQVVTQLTQSMNSAYNIIVNQMSKNAQNAIAFMGALSDLWAAVNKVSVTNQRVS